MPEFTETLPAGGASARLGDQAWPVLRDYVTLTKPRIMSLLVLTSVCAMVAAAHGTPQLGALAALVVGGGLACGGASALNHVLDRDIDRLMGPRTASRPVAAGRITPANATAFGIALSSLSFVILAVFANLLSAALALSGGAFYVLVYTVWLKRSTSQNIVIGGAAGAIPPLAGWAAAHGSLGLGADYLFAIVLLWTPPHFWTLALLLAPHYETAKVPMLPVVRGTSATTRQVLAYTLALTVATLLPGLLGLFGLLYEVSAVLLGGVFCALAWRLWRQARPPGPRSSSTTRCSTSRCSSSRSRSTRRSAEPASPGEKVQTLRHGSHRARAWRAGYVACGARARVPGHTRDRCGAPSCGHGRRRLPGERSADSPGDERLSLE